MKGKLLFFIFLFSSYFYFSCENDMETSGVYQTKKEYLKSLGVDVSKITIGGELNNKRSIVFESKESAIKFFELMGSKGLIYHGNTSNIKKYNDNFDIFSFLENDSIIETRSGGCPPWVLCAGGEDDRDLGSGGNCAKGIVKVVDWHIIHGYSVSFSYEKGKGGNYKVKDLKSGLSGFHAGISWTHESSIVSIVNGKIKFKVNGKQHYNIIVEGIGTVFSQDVVISGEYDPCTGNYKIKIE